MQTCMHFPPCWYLYAGISPEMGQVSTATKTEKNE